MPKRNPVLSMSGNMWERLTKYRSGWFPTIATSTDRTDVALYDRGFVTVKSRKGLPARFEISELGRMVADDYHEGQESKA